MNITEIAEHATTLAAFARASGFVVTIEQASTQPPTMGQHVDVVSVRGVRPCAAVIKRDFGNAFAGYEKWLAANRKPAHGGRNG